MKRFVKHIILFVIIFFVVEKITWFVLQNGPLKQFDTRIEHLVKGQINKELIVLGSSRGIGNILARQLENETNLSAYNLSYQGSNVNFHEYILKTLLKHNQTPKIIVLSIDNPSQFLDDKTITFRNDMLKPFTKYNYINETLIKQGETSRLSTLLFSARLHRAHFLFRKKTPHKNNPQDSSGTMPLLKKNSLYLFYDKDVTPYDITQEEPSKLKAFKSIQELCKTNGIRLIYAISPSFNAFNYNFYNRFKRLVNEKNIVLYDTLNPKYKDRAYYFDYTHLLKNGATLFTSEISTFINENKNLEVSIKHSGK